MDKNTLSHTTWECKYHIVFAPKFRRQVIYGAIKADVVNILASRNRDSGAVETYIPDTETAFDWFNYHS